VDGRLKSLLVDSYRFREVLINLLSQDLKVKYKRTYLGYIWSLLNPVLQLAVLTAVFSHIMRLGIKDYTLFLFSGLLAWTFVSTSLLTASSSLLESENFIKKVYLPKLIFPLSKVCLRLVDFFFSLVALGIIMAILGFAFKATIALLPVAIVILVVFVLGLSVILSVLTVYFRDIQYLVGVFLQLLYFGTPIIYPMEQLPSQYRIILQLNPFYPPIHLFQQVIYYGQAPSAQEWLTASGIALLSLVVGLSTLSAFDEDLVFRM
jgi:ABC-2 type transport system permease protein/lipopolysaccharide transport system permease protein